MQEYCVAFIFSFVQIQNRPKNKDFNFGQMKICEVFQNIKYSQSPRIRDWGPHSRFQSEILPIVEME